MALDADKPVWYRIYVLLVLLAVCISNLATRNLPSYLITVPVPDCEEACRDVVAPPLCGRDVPKQYPANRPPTKAETCRLCRARLVPQDTKPKFLTRLMAKPSVFHRSVHRHYLLATWGNTPPDAPILDTEVAWQEPNQDAKFYNLADGTCLYHWEYGILIGYGFAIVFAIGAIPAGYICDRRPRVNIATAALLTWSVATALQASANTFTFLLFCRAVIGLSQAFCLPATISVCADYFTEHQNTVMAVLSSGLYLGSGCASFSILIAVLLGWRWTVLLAGLLGMALTPVVYRTVQEPERTDWSAPCALSVVVDEVFEKSRVARMLIVAASAKMLAAYSLGAFLPIWYSRRGLQGYTSVGYACGNALVISAGGLLSAVLGAFLGKWWSRRDPRAPCWVGLLGAVAAVPLSCFMLLTQSFGTSMLCLFALLLLGESWFGPTVALLQTSVRRSVRGQAVSMFLVASSLVANLGPALVGFLDSGGERVGVHLLWISIAMNVVAAMAFILTAREIGIDPVAAGHGRVEEQYQDTSRGKAGTTHWALF